MKIIEQPHFICNDCSRKFEIMSEDIKLKVNGYGRPEKYVYCPVCGKEIKLG